MASLITDIVHRYIWLLKFALPLIVFVVPTFGLHNHMIFVVPALETSQNQVNCQQDELQSDTRVASVVFQLEPQ